MASAEFEPKPVAGADNLARTREVAVTFNSSQVLSNLLARLEPDSAGPSPETLSVTEELLLACDEEDMPCPSIYPSADGGVQIEWRTEGTSVEVEILNSGAANAFAFDVTGGEDRELTLAEVDTDELLNFVVEQLRG